MLLAPLLLVALPTPLAQAAPVAPRPIRLRLDYVESSAGLETPRLDGGFTEIEMGDVNGDGHLDLVSIGDHGSPYVNTPQHGIMVWRGDGAGSWSVVQSGDFGYGGCALGDVNGDGFLDVGYAMHHNYSGNDFGDQLIEVALGDGSAVNWSPWDDGLATNGESWGMSGTDLADVDADGDLDIACNSFGCCSGLHVYLNQGNGTWLQSFGFLGGNSNQDIAFGDVNGDGYPDLAAARGDATVWLNDGQGGFTAADGSLPGNPYSRSGPDLGDVDGDGRMDLAFADAAGGVQVWLAAGAGLWTASGRGLPAAGGFERVQLADMNVDGRLDLVAFGNGSLSVYLGDGGGSFARVAQRSTPSPGYATQLRVQHDLDHNGFPDIVLVAEEGGIFSRRNTLRCFLESSTPPAAAAALVAPGPRAVLRAGSVQFVDWVSALTAGLAATVDLELSVDGLAGPWVPVASGLPDSGRYQWTVPATPSTRCRLRLTLRTAAGALHALSPARFEIR